MSAKNVVQEFLAASAADVADARHLLAEDLEWEFNGEVQTTSAEAFVARQRADMASASAETVVDTLVSEGDEVIVIGWMSFTPHGEGQSTMRMRTAESFTLLDGRIARIKDVFATL